MDTEIITDNRQLAHQLIDEADEKLVNLFIALAHEYNDDFELSPAELKELEEDEEKFERGELEFMTEDEFWASFPKQKENV
jgi:hypothetical protein